jgi:hypothetical protein
MKAPIDNATLQSNFIDSKPQNSKRVVKTVLRPAILGRATEATTSDNKIYLLRRCGAVAPRVLGPTRQKIADKAQAGRLFCALPRGAPGTFGDAKRLYRLK